jgi:ribonuclease HII
LRAAIEKHALAIGVGIGTREEIDQINILESTRRAMRAAVAKARTQLNGAVGVLLVDGHLRLPDYEGAQWALVKGDSRSWAIAAASIVAKVTRDEMMVEYDSLYPEYGFAQHKGYGTVAHRRALQKYGLSPIHRTTFKWKAPR